MNYRLKAAIYAAGYKQREIADEAGLTELTMSRIVTGRRLASEREQKQLCTILHQTPEELFAECASKTGVRERQVTEDCER